jgi:RecA-family ATPase
MARELPKQSRLGKLISSVNNLSCSEFQNNTYSLFKIRTAQQCIDDAKKMPIPNMLFSEFWHEGELSILFADTNVGKSILAVQIADAISKGLSTSIFKMTAPKQIVLYIDFELSDKQFQNRYSIEYQNEYKFDGRLFRISINPDFLDYVDFDEILFSKLKELIENTGSKILIIDNITYLKTESTEKAKDALPLIKKLIELKNKYGLSILALAHTPKRNLSNPITQNDVSGSKHLANFVDSMFCIGVSGKSENLRYIKQNKARATEIYYGRENIMICEIIKEQNNLSFSFIEYGNEPEHLKQWTDTEKTELENKIIELKKENPTYSFRDIAKELNINHMKVKRTLEKCNKL